MEQKELKVRAMFVLDVIGKPPEHLIASLEKVIEEIDKEQGVVVKAKEIKQPTPIKENPEFYTTFAEVEVELDEIAYLVILMFKYMPAHIDIISPEIIAVTNNSWNDILNELTRRLHGYDEIVRIMQKENQMLKKKIEEVTGQQVVTPMTLKSEVEAPKPKKKKSVKKKPAKKKVKKK